MNESDQEYSEAQLAAEMGVDRSLLRKVRQAQLKEDEDYKTKNGAIILTEKAITFLKKALFRKKPPQPADGPPTAADEADPELADAFYKAVAEAAEKARVEDMVKKPPLMLSDGVQTLILFKKYRNKHIVGAHLEGQLVRVQVKNSQNFKRGMELPCVHVEQDLWKFVGRAPRGRKAVQFPGIEEGGK